MPLFEHFFFLSFHLFTTNKYVSAKVDCTCSFMDEISQWYIHGAQHKIFRRVEESNYKKGKVKLQIKKTYRIQTRHDSTVYLLFLL